MADAKTRNAVFAIIGGALWVLVPGVSVVGPQRLTAIVGILAAAGTLYGVLELRFEYGESLGTFGRTGCLLSGLGLAGVFLAALLTGIYIQANVVVTFVIGLLLAGGGVLLVVGSIVLAFGLWNQRLVPHGTTMLVGLGLPAGLLAAAVVSSSPLFGTVLYGVAWIVIGIRLRNGLAPGQETPPTPRVLVPSPPRLAALLAGATLTGLGIVGVVPSGPLTAEPVAGQSRLLDGVHLLLGVGGLYGSVAGTRPARRYGRLAGGLLVGFIAVWVVPPVRIVLGLTLVAVFVHVPLGLVLLGVAVADERFSARPTEAT